MVCGLGCFCVDAAYFRLFFLVFDIDALSGFGLNGGYCLVYCGYVDLL